MGTRSGVGPMNAGSALLDLPRDDGWRRAMRGHRRAWIAAQWMRIPQTMISEKQLRDGMLEELRLMLSLEASG